MLPEPPYSRADKDAMAKRLYEHVWQQSMGSLFRIRVCSLGSESGSLRGSDALACRACSSESGSRHQLLGRGRRFLAETGLSALAAAVAGGNAAPASTSPGNPAAAGPRAVAGRGPLKR